MPAEDVHDALVVVGTSVLGDWLAALLRDAQALSAVPFDLLEGEGVDLFPDLGRSHGAPRVLIAPALDRRLMDLVAAGGVRVAVVLDDPVDSVRYIRTIKGIDLLHALREQTRVAAGHHLYLDNPAAMLVQRNFRGTAHEVVAKVVEHLRLPIEAAELEVLLVRFGGPRGEPWAMEQALATQVRQHAGLSTLGEAVAAGEATIVRQVLSPMVLGALVPDIGPIVWNGKVFLFGDRPNEVAPPVADVTGAARILYYGPYFHLPPGTWTVRMLLAFSPEVRDTPFRLIVYCGGEAIAKVLLRPSAGGAFEGAFAMRHVAPERSIEIHFMNDEGTIEGHVALGQIIFERQAGAADPA